MAEEIQEIPTDLIDPSPFQPRELFDETKMLALMESIGANGVLQPIVVRPAGNRFELVMGERRVIACRRLGRPVPARVRPMSDEAARREALIENLLRENLQPMEKARAFGRLLEAGWSRMLIAARLSLELADVEFYTRLLNLRPEYQAYVEQGLLRVTSACDLARLPPADQPPVFAMYRRGKNPNDVARIITAMIEARAQAVLVLPEEQARPVADKLRVALEQAARAVGSCTSRQTLELLGWVTGGDVERNLTMATLLRKELVKIEEALKQARARADVRAEKLLESA